MKILILTEKHSQNRLYADALKSAKHDITITEIGGYLLMNNSPAKDTLQISDEYLQKALIVAFSDNTTGRLLGENLIHENIKKITELLNQNTFDMIVNACDADEDGKKKFEYVMRNISTDIPCVDLDVADLTETTIQNAFQKLFA